MKYVRMYRVFLLCAAQELMRASNFVPTLLLVLPRPARIINEFDGTSNDLSLSLPRRDSIRYGTRLHSLVYDLTHHERARIVYLCDVTGSQNFRLLRARGKSSVSSLFILASSEITIYTRLHEIRSANSAINVTFSKDFKSGRGRPE